MDPLPSPKLPDVERLRQLILKRSGDARETERAEPDLKALSFEGTVAAKRRVWAEVYSSGPGNWLIDLEDTDSDENWDHSVAHVIASSLDAAAAVVTGWLAGASVNECLNMAGDESARLINQL
jgi:hypothetical protein